MPRFQTLQVSLPRRVFFATLVVVGAARVEGFPGHDHHGQGALRAHPVASPCGIRCSPEYHGVLNADAGRASAMKLMHKQPALEPPHVLLCGSECYVSRRGFDSEQSTIIWAFPECLGANTRCNVVCHTRRLPSYLVEPETTSGELQRYFRLR